MTNLSDKFYQIYGNRNNLPVLFFSPGRVNLIGEHTDYNKGYVFPCSLDYGTYLLIRKTNKNTISLNSTNFKFTDSIDLKSIRKNKLGEWINYPLGVIKEFIDRNIDLCGLELLFSGNIPNGAGLSSSASIEMVTAVSLNELFNAGLSTMEMVKLCQHAENDFVGMNCGIMDQFAVGFGEKNKAIFLNCDSLEYETVPVNLNDYQLIIANTNKRRGLTDSKYNERRAECEQALAVLTKEVTAGHLSEFGIDQISLLDRLIEDDTIKRRARHVITENNRVLEAVKALKEGNIIRFGELMNQSHDSLKDDYEVTGFELDTMVYQARQLNGVLGSRMTGAGFGGCTVSIVHKSETDNFVSSLKTSYQKETGLKADFYLPEIGAGARKL